MQNGNKATIKNKPKKKTHTYSTGVFVIFVDFDRRALHYPEAARGEEFFTRSAPRPPGCGGETLRLIINQRPLKMEGESEDLSSPETEGRLPNVALVQAESMTTAKRCVRRPARGLRYN